MVPTKHFEIVASGATIVFAATSSVHPIRSVGSIFGWIEACILDGRFEDGHELGGYLEVPLGGLSAGNPLIDREMKRRINPAKHPTIKATIEETLAVEGSRATIAGTIDFLGTSTLVEGEVALLPGPVLIGTGELDVRWWGLEPPRLLMLRVDPIVTVEIEAPLVECP